MRLKSRITLSRHRSSRPVSYTHLLTSYEQFALESYELDAFQYILKSRMEERLPRALAKLFEKFDQEYGNYRVVEHSAKVVKLLYRDVFYVRKEGK